MISLRVSADAGFHCRGWRLQTLPASLGFSGLSLHFSWEGSTFQCSITFPFQPVIPTAILTPAPHHPGLQHTQGSSLRAQQDAARPRRDRRSRLSAQNTSPLRPALPNFGTVSVRDRSWDSWDPSVNVALSSTAPRFVQHRQRKVGGGTSPALLNLDKTGF